MGSPDPSLAAPALEIESTGEIARRADVNRHVVIYVALQLGIPVVKRGQSYLFHRRDSERLIERLIALKEQVKQLREPV